MFEKLLVHRCFHLQMKEGVNAIVSFPNDKTGRGSVSTVSPQQLVSVFEPLFSEVKSMKETRSSVRLYNKLRDDLQSFIKDKKQQNLTDVPIFSESGDITANWKPVVQQKWNDMVRVHRLRSLVLQQRMRGTDNRAEVLIIREPEGCEGLPSATTEESSLIHCGAWAFDEEHDISSEDSSGDEVASAVGVQTVIDPVDEQENGVCNDSEAKIQLSTETRIGDTLLAHNEREQLAKHGDMEIDSCGWVVVDKVETPAAKIYNAKWLRMRVRTVLRRDNDLYKLKGYGENKGQGLEMSNSWCRQQFRLAGLVSRKTGKDVRKIPLNCDLLTLMMSATISQLCKQYNIPSAFVLNLDQTHDSLLSSVERSWCPSGSDTPSKAGNHGSTCTLVPVVMMNGYFVGIQIIYKGTSRLVTATKVTENIKGLLTGATSSTFSTLRTMQELYLYILYPAFCSLCRKSGRDIQTQKMIVLLDHASVHMSYRFLHWVSAFFPNWIHVFVPRNTTGVAQPLDLNVMGPLKSGINMEKMGWMNRELRAELNKHDERLKKTGKRSASKAELVRNGYSAKVIPKALSKVFKMDAAKKSLPPSRVILKAFEMAMLPQMFPRELLLPVQRGKPAANSEGELYRSHTEAELTLIYCLQQTGSASEEMLVFKPWEGLADVNRKLQSRGSRKKNGFTCLNPARALDPEDATYESEVDMDMLSEWPRTTTAAIVAERDYMSWKRAARLAATFADHSEDEDGEDNSLSFQLHTDGVSLACPSTRGKDKIKAMQKKKSASRALSRNGGSTRKRKTGRARGTKKSKAAKTTNPEGAPEAVRKTRKDHTQLSAAATSDTLDGDDDSVSEAEEDLQSTVDAEIEFDLQKAMEAKTDEEFILRGLEEITFGEMCDRKDKRRRAASMKGKGMANWDDYELE